jgi:predicted phage-related endonuclease
MLWGNLLEEVVAKEAARRCGFVIKAKGKPVQDAVRPWRIATPDFWVEADGQLGLLQVKTTSSFMKDRWEEGPADGAHIQVAQEMSVTGAPYCYLAVLIGGQELRVFRLERDAELEGTVLELTEEFWDCVRTLTPPPVIGKDLAILNSQYEVTPGRSVIAQEMEPTVSLWRQFKEQESLFKDRRETAEAQIKAFMKEAEELATDRFIVSWKGEKARRFNVKERKERKDG